MGQALALVKLQIWEQMRESHNCDIGLEKNIGVLTVRYSASTVKHINLVNWLKYLNVNFSIAVLCGVLYSMV